MVSSHHHTAEHGMVTHIVAISGNLGQQMNELPTLESLCSIVYSVIWIHPGLWLNE
jgi:hypothetical protein